MSPIKNATVRCLFFPPLPLLNVRRGPASTGSPRPSTSGDQDEHAKGVTT